MNVDCALARFVGSADAGLGSVDRTDPATGGGHVTADAGQQHDDCSTLAHIGRFTLNRGQ
jgi:hypothetical protein